MTVTIIDYGSGNLRSAQKAFERAARESGYQDAIIVTDDPEKVRLADHIVLPGVGAFRDCRDGLAALPGMSEVLSEQVIDNARPFLGICVGMQLMATKGLEGQETNGFGWIDGTVEKIVPDDSSLKIPHMGWNILNVSKQHPVLDSIQTGPDGLHAYFVHSYHLTPVNKEDLVATTDYGQTITAIVARDNMIGTQFHPEKSQKLGLAMITNFLSWKP